MPVVIALVVVLVVAGVGVGLALAVGGGGDEPDPTPSPEALSLDDADVDARYAALGESVTARVESCESAETELGETERLTCTTANGTLDLVTYESSERVTSARTRTITYGVGAVIEADDTAAFYSYEPATSDYTAGGDAVVYWDSVEEAVSATLRGSGGTATKKLVSDFEATSPTVEEPTEPSDAGLRDFGGSFVDLTTCTRIANLTDGELEENSCTGPGGIVVYLAEFKSASDFRTYRSGKKSLAEDSGVRDYRTWNFDGGDGEVEGALFEYLDDTGNAVLYWDQPQCRCYAEAYQPSGDLDQLYDWWAS